MKLRYKITRVILTFLVVGFSALAITLSYTSDCADPPAIDENAPLMKAVVYRCYGSPEVLKVENIAKPVPADDEVLVKVRAAGVNPLDWHYMRGTPYLMRLMSGIGAPDDISMGVDFSGTVESVGSKVTKFKPGDEVFGGRGGAFAEYITVPEDRGIALKPTNMSFEQSATVAIAAVTALQALRDKGRIKPGQKVLINGASGGVGTFAVQIAKSYGAEVTGVSSTRNLELVKSLGADHVIDYKHEDYIQSGKRYDLIIDMVSNHSLLENREVLTENGILVSVGGSTDNWLGPLKGPLGALILSPFVDQEFAVFIAKIRQDDLVILRDLMQAGKLKPIVGRRYSLAEVPAAITYSEEGHTRGKIVININL